MTKLDNVWFLLAHQDDEFAILRHIASAPNVRTCKFVYLTDGNWNSVSSEERNSETVKALSRLSISRDQILFLGSELEIKDGTLVQQMYRCFRRLIQYSEEIGRPSAIVSHAWEGGHQDHDAAHVICLALGDYFNVLDECRQFTFYRASNSKLLPIKIFSSIKENGELINYEKLRISELFYLYSLATIYKTQWKTFVVILSFSLWRWFLCPHYFQPVRIERIFQRPHAGILLYEMRKRMSWGEFMSAVRIFLIETDSARFKLATEETTSGETNGY